jgi:hypothetical protein
MCSVCKLKGSTGDIAKKKEKLVVNRNHAYSYVSYMLRVVPHIDRFNFFELEEPPFNQEGSTKGNGFFNKLKNPLFKIFCEILKFGL